MFLLFFFSILLISACSYDKYDELIPGKWKVVEWTANGNVKGDVTDDWFDFKTDGTYSSRFGGLQQEGTYRLEYNRLYTKAEGESEIVVKIESLTSDSLKIGMNRGGRPEILVLAH